MDFAAALARTPIGPSSGFGPSTVGTTEEEVGEGRNENNDEAHLGATVSHHRLDDTVADLHETVRLIFTQVKHLMAQKATSAASVEPLFRRAAFLFAVHRRLSGSAGSADVARLMCRLCEFCATISPLVRMGYLRVPDPDRPDSDSDLAAESPADDVALGLTLLCRVLRQDQPNVRVALLATVLIAILEPALATGTASVSQRTAEDIQHVMAEADLDPVVPRTEMTAQETRAALVLMSRYAQAEFDTQNGLSLLRTCPVSRESRSALFKLLRDSGIPLITFKRLDEFEETVPEPTVAVTTTQSAAPAATEGCGDPRSAPTNAKKRPREPEPDGAPLGSGIELKRQKLAASTKLSTVEPQISAMAVHLIVGEILRQKPAATAVTLADYKAFVSAWPGFAAQHYNGVLEDSSKLEKRLKNANRKHGDFTYFQRQPEGSYARATVPEPAWNQFLQDVDAARGQLKREHDAWAEWKNRTGA